MEYHKKYIKYKKKYIDLRNQKGGKKLGKGSHGIVYDVACDNSQETLCYFIDKKKVKQIIIHDKGIDNSYKIDFNDEFIGMLSEAENKIAKIFTSKQDFINELNENFKIKDIYASYDKEGKSPYITIEPIFKFNGKDIYSSEIHYENKEIHYILYSTKCQGNIKESRINLHKLIIDILESLVILQEHDYMHNDIKLDNIVLCDTKYKLIDWGASNNYSVTKRGSLLGTNPIRLYIMDWVSPKSMISLRSYQKIGLDYIFDPTFIKINSIINDEYDLVLARNRDKEYLKEKYKKSFDIFMLGMTILHVLFLMKDTVIIENYLSLVIKFVSLTNPVKDASEALDIAKEHFENLRITTAFYRP